MKLVIIGVVLVPVRIRRRERSRRSSGRALFSPPETCREHLDHSRAASLFASDSQDEGDYISLSFGFQLWKLLAVGRP